MSIEKIGSNDVIVQNYTSNHDIKDYIINVMIPRTFPYIDVSKLNLGFVGIVSDLIGTVVEDSYASATLMMNESFISRAELPESIESAAAVYDIGYDYAKPSKCEFALELWLPDILKYSSQVRNTSIMRYHLDKNTKIILGDNPYTLDYDIIIDWQFIDGQRVYNVYYDMEEPNSMSTIKSKYIKHQVTSVDWFILFIELNQFERKVEENTISDNLVTNNSDIKLRWNNQIAGIDLTYITPSGQRQTMKLKNVYTDPDIEPFAWHRYENDNTMILSFPNNDGYFIPAFNSKIESTIYVCKGSAANFDTYDRRTGIPVQKTGERFDYNPLTKMVALTYSGSTGGLNRGNIGLLRRDVLLAQNTVNVLTTDNDLKMWFERNAVRYGTRSEFFKRRDDPTGRLFSQFIAITDNSYIYPTNTLTIEMNQDQFDFVNSDINGNNTEFIIQPGHLWEYVEDSRDTVRMIDNVMVYDEALPPLTNERGFMFTNPFYIKIYRDPTISANYNCLLDHTSWPETVSIDSESFYQFQLATFSIQRSLSKKYNNKYHIEIVCVPSVTSDKNMKYVEGIGNDFSVLNNNLRMILVTRTANDGETGYIEMIPTEIRESGAIVFETDITMYDNIRHDMTLEVDLDKTEGLHSLIMNGERAGRVFLDSNETSFHFICMMKDFAGKQTTALYGNDSFKGYLMANRFANDHRNLTLYKPMNMMRSVITFAGSNNNYQVRASLIPFLKYDIPLNEDRMKYFIRAFDEQYKAMEPVLSKLDGNSYIDFKLFNTYGKSSNYYIGPKDGDDVLRNSDILLDNVYVKIKLRMAVNDRSMYSQTEEAVINDIKSFFETLNSGEVKDIHISDLIHMIIENQPNVRYIRFLGFNNYDANKQSIFVKYNDISELKEDELQPHVPEMIRVDSNSIEIIEET